MENGAIPDRLVGCTTCGAFFRWTDDRLTVKDHPAGGRDRNPECPGSGTEGLDLGARELYSMDRDGDLVYLGARDDLMMSMQCPHCVRKVSIRKPPDEAFDRRFQVLVRCSSCRELSALDGLIEGPQGDWVRRSR